MVGDEVVEDLVERQVGKNPCYPNVRAT